MTSQKTYRVQNLECIKMPRSCWGRYASVSVIGPDGEEWCSGPVCMGSTSRCAQARAIVEADEYCLDLNRKARANYMSRARRAAKKLRVEMARLNSMSRCCAA